MKAILFGMAAATGFVSLPAAAQVKVVDQFDNTTSGANGTAFVSNGVTNGSEPNGRVGQSFTPSLASLNFFTFDIINFGSSVRNANGTTTFQPSIDTSLAVYLYGGDGTATQANLLGMSQAVSIAANAPRATVQFDFTTPIVLVPLRMYTARIFDLTNLANPSIIPGASAFSCAGSYTGGDATVGPGNDLCFSEGISTPAMTGSVPEPATWAMMLLGFGGVGYALRRKAKVGTPLRLA